MSDVNVKIIEVLKNFLSLLCSHRALQERFCCCEKAFTRKRKLPFERLVLLIVRLCKKTLSTELEHFFEQMDLPLTCSVSAFVQQRTKLDALFFYIWNRVLWASYYLYAAHGVQRFEGYRIMAADGSSLSLVNNKALSKYFGGQSNQQTSYVMAKTFYHYDVLNELVVLPMIKPYRYGELNMAYDAIEEVEEDMLMLYERNFCNYKMAALHLWQERERKFVIRAKETQNMIKAFIKSGQASAIVYMTPTASAIKGLRKSGYIITKDTLLKVRLVRVELPEAVEVLLTNLWPEDGFANELFKDLYALRWGVETNIWIQKNILQLESFSGLSVEAVLQDFYATVLMANLHSVLIKGAQQSVEGATKHRKYPMKINRNKSFGKLKAALVALFISKDPNSILKQLHHYFTIHILPVRKGRSFARKRKNVQSKSRYKTLTNFKPAF